MLQSVYGVHSTGKTYSEMQKRVVLHPPEKRGVDDVESGTYEALAYHERRIVPYRNPVQQNTGEETSEIEDNGLLACQLRLLRNSGKIITLQDSLSFFKLHPVLIKLENSLEDVRRNKKEVQEHELCLKEADKKMQKLCMKFHPDRIKNRGGNQREISVAVEVQTALNMTRNVINIISREFLEELHVYYKYDFFTDMRLYSLGNEDQLQKRINDVLYKIGLLSSIKHENIVARMQKFLKSSRAGIHCCVNLDESGFRKQYHLALFHLEQCIEGYEKLLNELQKAEKESRRDGLVKMAYSIRQLLKKSSSDLDFLKALEENKHSLDEAFYIFQNYRKMDDYFVLPFAYYVNILLMCSIVEKKKMQQGSLSDRIESSVKKTLYKSVSWKAYKFDIPENAKDLELLQFAYFLLSYLEGKTFFEREARFVMKELDINKENLILKWYVLLVQIEAILEKRFESDSFNTFTVRGNLMEKLAKINKASASDIVETDGKIEKRLDNFLKKNEKRKQEFQKIVKEDHEVKKTINRSSKRLDKIMSVLKKDGNNVCH